MLIIVRIIVLCLLLCGTLFFGILPICIKPYLNACQCSKLHLKGCATKKQRIATCFLIFFGGGVLLATCLVHLLHEVHQGFEEALAKCLEIDSNLTNYIEVTSTTAENLQTDLLVNTESTEYKNEEQMTSNSDESTTMSVINLLWHKNISRPFQSVLEKEPVYDKVLCSSDIVKTLFPLPEFITVCGFFLIYFVEELIKFVVHRYHYFKSSSLEFTDMGREKATRSALMTEKNGQVSLKELKIITSQKENENGITRTDANNMFLENNQDSTLFRTVDTTERKKSINDLHFFYGQTGVKELNIEGLDDFITVLALSFNSVFEGFAAGFQHTEVSTWMLFVSLALHKFVSAFAVSLETLHSGGSNFRVSLYVIMFSLMCPIGMLAATFTHSNLVDSGSLQVGVLNALAVGTLLYVTFYEMLRQRKDFAEISGFAQFFVLLLGFIAMSIVEYFYTRVE